LRCALDRICDDRGVRAGWTGVTPREATT
jgi:hypothetical protein